MSVFKRFLESRSGNFALTFALSSLPLFGMAGAALDYSRWHSAKTELQQAADSAALAAIVAYYRDDADLATEADMARDFFESNVTTSLSPEYAVNLSPDGSVATVVASIDVPTTMLSILGYKSIRASTQAEARIGQARIQIAMALDSTGSMGSLGKLSTMKTAAKDFVDNIVPLGYPSSNLVEFAIVPFTTVVRGPSSWGSQPWLDLNGIAEADFDGCIWDRDPALDSSDSDPVTTNPATFYQASPDHLYETSICSFMEPMRPLTRDRSIIKASIDGIVADGATNTNIGAVWAMNMLSDSEPYRNAQTGTRKFLVLLTDGENTNGRIIDAGGSISQMDDATLETCNEAKARDIQIYSIRVIEGNETMLQGCASSPSHYYNLTDPAQLDNVFADISRKIWEGMVRLSR